MWFDSVRGGHVDYTNYTYLVSGTTQKGFPNLISEIENNVAESMKIWDKSNFELLESITLAVVDAAQTTIGVNHVLSRE